MKLVGFNKRNLLERSCRFQANEHKKNMSETGGLKAIEVPSFCWLSSNCNKINEKSIEVWNFNKAKGQTREMWSQREEGGWY